MAMIGVVWCVVGDEGAHLYLTIELNQISMVESSLVEVGRKNASQFLFILLA